MHRNGKETASAANLKAPAAERVLDSSDSSDAELIAAQLCSRAIYPQGPQARGNSAGQSSSAPRQGALQYFECRRKLFRCMCTCTPAHHSVAGQVFVHLLDRRTLHRSPYSPTCDCVKDPSALILQVIGVSWSRWTVRKRSPCDRDDRSSVCCTSLASDIFRDCDADAGQSHGSPPRVRRALFTDGCEEEPDQRSILGAHTLVHQDATRGGRWWRINALLVRVRGGERGHVKHLMENLPLMANQRYNQSLSPPHWEHSPSISTYWAEDSRMLDSFFRLHRRPAARGRPAYRSSLLANKSAVGNIIKLRL